MRCGGGAREMSTGDNTGHYRLCTLAVGTSDLSIYFGVKSYQMELGVPL